jgi:MFS family permease
MATVLTSSKPRNPMLDVLGQRNFRLLWIGQGTSLLGDQFALIALPWLVLQLTGDPLALGIVMALTGAPRAIFMLVGGAAADRFSHRGVMLVTDLVRLVLTVLLTVMVLTGYTQMWVLCAFALAIGTASGFFIPASNAILPTMVKSQELAAGNSIFQGTAQLSQFIGPSLAGGVIAWFAHRLGASAGAAGSPGLQGIALALGIDAVTFAVSVITLWMMTSKKPGQAAAGAAAGEKMGEAIRSGVKYLLNDPFLRLTFILMAAANFLFSGPLLVGIPVLANTRFPEGAMAFGMIMSAYAAGNLVGILAAGALPKPDGVKMRLFIVGLFAVFGLVLASFSWLHNTWLAAGVMLLAGLGNGYLAITLITALQRRTPVAMLGRLMSLVMVASYGLMPLSQALAGALSKWSLNTLFILSGAAMILLAAWSAFQPELRTAGEVLLTAQPVGD